MTKRAKIIKPEGCSTGNHLFIVSQWTFDSKSQKANSWACQRCLLSIDGGYDVNQLRKELHENGDGETKT